MNNDLPGIRDRICWLLVELMSRKQRNEDPRIISVESPNTTSNKAGHTPVVEKNVSKQVLSTAHLRKQIVESCD